MNEKKKYTNIIMIIVPVLVALLSFFVISKYTASTEYNAKTIQSLDDKKTTVMELAGASTAASAAITLIPGDVGTPIAQKLADLSSCFLVVLCAIYLEKYLVTITGYVAFKIMIPVACGIFLLYVFSKKEALKSLAVKFLLVALAIYFVIPASVKVSDMIQNTYESSIQETIDTAKNATDEIESQTSNDKDESSSTEQSESTEKKSDSEGFLSGVISKAKDGVSKIENSLTAAKVDLENILNRFVEAIAILIVTSCLIPMLVLLFFVWLIKMIFVVNINIPKIQRKN